MGGPSQKTYSQTPEEVVSAFKAAGTDKNAADFTIGSSVLLSAVAGDSPVAASFETAKGLGAVDLADALKARSNSPAVGAVKNGSAPAPAGNPSGTGTKSRKKNRSQRRKKTAQADVADGGGWTKVEQKSNARKVAAPGAEPLRHGEATLSHTSMQLYSKMQILQCIITIWPAFVCAM